MSSSLRLSVKRGHTSVPLIIRSQLSHGSYLRSSRALSFFRRSRCPLYQAMRITRPVHQSISSSVRPSGNPISPSVYRPIHRACVLLVQSISPSARQSVRPVIQSVHPSGSPISPSVYRPIHRSHSIQFHSGRPSSLVFSRLSSRSHLVSCLVSFSIFASRLVSHFLSSSRPSAHTHRLRHYTSSWSRPSTALLGSSCISPGHIISPPPDALPT